jgi:hypothetical protein
MKTFMFKARNDKVQTEGSIFSRLRNTISAGNPNIPPKTDNPPIANATGSNRIYNIRGRPQYNTSPGTSTTAFRGGRGGRRGGGGRGGFTGRGGRGRRDSDDNRRSYGDRTDDLDPAVKAMLFDLDYFQDLVNEGKTIKTDGFDEFGKLLS